MSLTWSHCNDPVNKYNEITSSFSTSALDISICAGYKNKYDWGSLRENLVLNLLDAKTYQENLNIVFSYFVKVCNQTVDSLGNYLRIMKKIQSALDEIRIQGEFVMRSLVLNKLRRLHKRVLELITDNKELTHNYEYFCAQQ